MTASPTQPDSVTAPDGYPRFSAEEMARRRQALAEAVERAGAKTVVVYGATRGGTAVPWLTQWPVTREAAVTWSPGAGDPALYVQFANHLDNARELAQRVDVRWGGSSTFETLARDLRRSAGSGRYPLALVGPLPASAARLLAEAGADLVFLDRAYRELRQVKSAEEIGWVRRGAELTDAAVRALAQGTKAGMTETELGALVETAYVAAGGSTHIHYFATTPMASPQRRAPAQWPSTRRLEPGDVVVCEISAAWWGYPGQLLRTFTVEADPTPLYRRLHEVAEEAFAAISERVAPGATGADLAEAATLVEKAGLATCDDLVHGFVGGYLPPVVPGTGRPPQHAAFVLEPHMTLVVQPNVVTPDAAAGVQTGELLLVTESGYERLHRYPAGLGHIGG
ncbi:MAG: M24 family metallopeptidase [Acidimicrobiales bacterium]